MVEHVDPEDLALIALGERPTAADAAHLDRCRACADEVASLAAVVAVGRSVRPDDAPIAPAPAVWDRVRDELGLAPGLRPEPTGVVGDVAVDRDPTGGQTVTGVRRAPATAAPGALPPRPSPADDRPVERPEPASAEVVPLRRRVAPWVAAAAACGVVLGAAGGAWWASRDTAAEPATIAQAPLDPLPGWAATGSARVEQDAAGDRTLVVTLDGTGTDEGYHEVWLIDRDVTRLVSLGVLTGTEGRFAVPPNLDLDQFPVVDVSDEPLDGDPAHSGESIIRGVLGA
jgi:hypothetical protein